MLIVGFREWPPGREHPADVDSGPIVHGIGTAASALAIGAARSMGDTILAARLEAAARAATRLAGPAAQRAAQTQLASAILERVLTQARKIPEGIRPGPSRDPCRIFDPQAGLSKSDIANTQSQ